MNKFKSITEFEDFVNQTRSEYLEHTETMLFGKTNVDYFLIQLNTNLNNRGFEILKSDPAPPDSDFRATAKFRLAKGIGDPFNLEKHDNIVQKHIDSIEKDGK